MNEKYEITDISHEKYPWLHRICALRDICEDVKKGDLGGFAESEKNLSFEENDTAWIYDDAVACGDSLVCQGSKLRNIAIAKDRAYISANSLMTGRSIVEDDAMIQGTVMRDNARVSGCGMALQGSLMSRPELSDNAAVYGIVRGNFHLSGTTVILDGEKLNHEHGDRVSIHDGNRVIERIENVELSKSNEREHIKLSTKKEMVQHAHGQQKGKNYERF